MIEVAFRFMEKQDAKDIGPDGLRSARSSKPNWTRAFELLRGELKKIRATNVVVEAGYRPDQVRADGWPYSNAVPIHEQIRLSFTKDGEPVSFFQGTFAGSIACVAYNAWLIGMTLQALRAVDRYGCTQTGQQYKGWAQLPPGRDSIAAAEWPTVEVAVRFLMLTGWNFDLPGSVNAFFSGEPFKELYRDAARTAHPDAGGSVELMARVNRARDYIESAQKGAQ